VGFHHASPSSEPRAAFAFSEGTGTSVADVTGNGNTGTLFNGPVWTSSGKYGNGLVLTRQ